MKLDPITIQVMWSRLIAIVDEAASGLIRTAYTPSVKEYHDFCCALFDQKGNMLAHSTVTTAGFLGIVPAVMGNFLDSYPIDSFSSGDVLITNDPWLASGHLIDVTVAQPVFINDRVIGFALCIVHHLDMGGRMATLESKDMYEEGLKIPILKLFEGGVLNESIFEFIRANIRVPEKVLGDIRAQLIANHICSRGLINAMDEYEMTELSELSSEIVTRTETSLRKQIKNLPDGTFSNKVILPPIPGCIDQVEICVSVKIFDDEILIDYSGSSGEVDSAINCTLTMTKSYSSYPIKLALDPTVPNNAGALVPINVIAPEGSVVNCKPPRSTWGRTMISHLFPEIMFGALKNVIPDYVLAGNGGTPANEVYIHGKDVKGKSFMAIQQHSGGYGASVYYDGYSTLCFPNNTSNIPIEVTENEASIFYTKKEFIKDSGGPGHHRGGLGQEVEFCIRSIEQIPEGFVECSVRISGRTEDGSFPVTGLFGGKNGRFGGLWLNDKPVEHGVYRKLFPGDIIRFEISGGGGYNDPFKRNPVKVLADFREGYVSSKGALKDYRVVIKGLLVDEIATKSLRTDNCINKNIEP